jgi:hypothetical protein
MRRHTKARERVIMCGCGSGLRTPDEYGRSRKYLQGHNRRIPAGETIAGRVLELLADGESQTRAELARSLAKFGADMDGPLSRLLDQRAIERVSHGRYRRTDVQPGRKARPAELLELADKAARWECGEIDDDALREAAAAVGRTDPIRMYQGNVGDVERIGASFPIGARAQLEARAAEVWARYCVWGWAIHERDEGYSQICASEAEGHAFLAEHYDNDGEIGVVPVLALREEDAPCVRISAQDLDDIGECPSLADRREGILGRCHAVPSGVAEHRRALRRG